VRCCPWSDWSTQVIADPSANSAIIEADGSDWGSVAPCPEPAGLLLGAPGDGSHDWRLVHRHSTDGGD